MDDNCHGFLGVESQDRKEGHEWDEYSKSNETFFHSRT